MEKSNTIEENFEEIQKIITAMQGDEMTMNYSFEHYKKGLELVINFNEQIDKIEKEMQIISEGNGNV